MRLYTFSLIVATYGRYLELDRFLKSIYNQNYDHNLVQVWVIDQNDQIDISPLVSKYKEKICLKHIKSNKKGTSYNRNLAIRYSDSDIIAFPDDDCTYYENTLSSVAQFFNRKPNCDCVLGKIYDISSNKNIVRNWKKNSMEINWWNFYNNFSEIVLFINTLNYQKVYFCEKLGPGEYFGSCEGIDYLVRYLHSNRQIYYQPKIMVWHPMQNIALFDEEKINRYGFGFGAFCKKNINIYTMLLFCEAILYHTVCFFYAWVKGKHREMHIREICIFSRFKGWREWGKSKDVIK